MLRKNRYRSRSRRLSWLNAYLFLVVFGLLGTLASRTLHLDPGPIAPASAVLTLATGLMAAFQPILRRERRAGSVLLSVFGVGLLAELVGVATAFPFGAYRYTDRWWPTVPYLDGRFPLLVPFAWVLVAGASYLTVVEYWRAPVWRWISAATLAAVIDLVMEPTMVGPLGYWKWSVAGPLPGGVPVSNFLGWWGTSFVAAWLLDRAKVGRTSSPAAPWVLLGHLVLILGIGLITELTK